MSQSDTVKDIVVVHGSLSRLNISDFQFLVLLDKTLSYSRGGFGSDTLSYQETIYIRDESALKHWIANVASRSDFSTYTILSIKPVEVETEITVKVVT
jgi:hypothetical protein